jgi:hypothetical protein
MRKGQAPQPGQVNSLTTRSSYMIPKAEPEGITEPLENIPEELRQCPERIA